MSLDYLTLLMIAALGIVGGLFLLSQARAYRVRHCVKTY